SLERTWGRSRFRSREVVTPREPRCGGVRMVLGRFRGSAPGRMWCAGGSVALCTDEMGVTGFHGEGCALARRGHGSGDRDPGALTGHLKLATPGGRQSDELFLCGLGVGVRDRLVRPRLSA